MIEVKRNYSLSDLADEIEREIRGKGVAKLCFEDREIYDGFIKGKRRPPYGKFKDVADIAVLEKILRERDVPYKSVEVRGRTLIFML